MDWDKVRIFYAAATAGSFTHAGDELGMSQSAVSRQVQALENELKVSLFHRHARGLMLTEQGELLFRTARDVLMKLQTVSTLLTDARDKPHGELRVTATIGLGTGWLAPRIGDFMDMYPNIKLQLILDDNELNLTMREADVAIRMHQPTQPNLIQRKLFTAHYHVYASTDYIRRMGQPQTIEEIDKHRIMTYGPDVPPAFRDLNWLETVGKSEGDERVAQLHINNIYGLKHAVQRGFGIAVLPDYLMDNEPNVVRILQNEKSPEGQGMPEFDTYFVYPEEIKNTKKIAVFRDFLLAQAERWSY